MTMRNETQANPLRLVPMCALLSLLLLWAAESTGWFALLFLLPIALCLLPLAAERLWGWLVLIVLVTAAVVLVLPVKHYVWLAYACVLAPYVPIRYALRNLKNPRGATLLAVGIVTVWTAAVLALLLVFRLVSADMQQWLLYVLLGFGYFLFLFLLDAAYQLMLRWYQNRLRRFLLPRA